MSEEMLPVVASILLIDLSLPTGFAKAWVPTNKP